MIPRTFLICASLLAMAAACNKSTDAASGSGSAAPASSAGAQSGAAATGDLKLLQAGTWNEKDKPKWTKTFRPDMSYRSESSSADFDGKYKVEGKLITIDIPSRGKPLKYNLDEVSEHKLVLSDPEAPTYKTEFTR
jgi:hypothetical protein